MKQIEFPKHKKSAIVSLGTRISLTSVNVRSVDFIFLREYLLKVEGRELVDFVSKKTKKEKDIEYFKDVNDVDFNDYDEVIIYNASLNPFGGLFKTEALDTFVKLYTFKGDIHYMLCDPKMPPIDFAKYLQYKDKTHSYVFGCDSKALDFKYSIEPEVLDNWTEKVWNRSNVMYAGFDYGKYATQWNEVYKNSKNKYKLLNTDVNWFNVWIFEYYAVNEELDLKMKNYKKVDNPFELVYFGNNRQNERNKVIKKLFDIPEYTKYFIGLDTEIENSVTEKYVPHQELFKEIGEKCLATVVVGDNLHNDNERTPRFFEAMLLDCVAFIYIEYDPSKRYVKDEFLKDFIYVSSKDELKERIEQIKNDKELYNKIIELERKDIIDQFTYLKR